MKFITSLSSCGWRKWFFFTKREFSFIHTFKRNSTINIFLSCVSFCHLNVWCTFSWQFLTIFGHFWPFFKCLIDMDILKLLLFLKFFLLITGHSMTKKIWKAKWIGKIGGISSVGLNCFYLLYRKFTISRLSRLVAHPSTFRIFMKGKFDAYVI